MSSGVAVRAEDSQTGRQLLAQGIIQALQETSYTTSDGQMYDIAQKNQNLLVNTRYYRPNSTTLQLWRNPPAGLANVATGIHFRLQSTISAAREWALSPNPLIRASGQIGVLNCGAPDTPGGGFEWGRDCQEASLVRASNLSLSLKSPIAKPFYEKQWAAGWYTDAMIYSKGVTIMRDDRGLWAQPVEVDVVTSVPVEATTVGAGVAAIESRMEERMGRILAIFEFCKSTTLILTGFGAGASGNSISSIAKIWVRLLGPDRRFQGSFQNVVFAIREESVFNEFCQEFREELARRSV